MTKTNNPDAQIVTKKKQLADAAMAGDMTLVDKLKGEISALQEQNRTFKGNWAEEWIAAATTVIDDGTQDGWSVEPIWNSSRMWFYRQDPKAWVSDPTETSKRKKDPKRRYSAHQILDPDGDMRGGVWIPMTKSNLDNSVAHFIRARSKGDYDARDFDDAMKLILALCANDSVEFVSPGIAFANGSFFRKNCEFIKDIHHPDYHLTFGYDFDYKTTPVRPFKWDQLLTALFQGDPDAEEKKKLICEFIGACLLGCAADFQQCLVFYAESGRNGKSTLIDCINALFPKGFRTNVEPKRWGDQYYIASLAQSRLNTCADISHGKIMDGEMLKKLIAGDDMSAREPYGKPFTFKPRGGSIFSCNQLPATDDTTNGFFRRFVIIGFNNTFSGMERSIDTIVRDILTEQQEIINHCVTVCGALPTNEYTMPKSAVDLKDMWLTDEDTVREFIDSCCAKDPNALTKVTDLHAAYDEYIRPKKRRTVSTMTFGKRLTQIGYKGIKREDNTYYQLAILPEDKWANHTTHSDRLRVVQNGSYLKNTPPDVEM